MWGLPPQAHRYLIEELGGQHAQTMLIIRFVRFLQFLKSSDKLCVQLLLQKVSRNVNTITGKNIEFILSETGRNFDLFIQPNMLKKKLKFCEIKTEEKRRVGMIREIVNIRQNILTLEGEGFSPKEMNELIQYVSTT